MTDIYQNTDKRSESTNPETPRLLAQGIIDIPVADYYAVTGGYISVYSLNITDLNDLGNRVKGFTPQTLDIRVYKTTLITPGGQINDYFNPAPFTKFNNYSTGEVDEQVIYQVTNQYITADQIAISLLDITHFSRTLPGRTQSFSYKIYSTIYEFTDTYS